MVHCVQTHEGTQPAHTCAPPEKIAFGFKSNLLYSVLL